MASGNRVYEQVLPAWGEISRGAFTPIGVREDWGSDSGPIEVSFELGGRPVCVRPEYLNDWIDLGVLTSLNELIADSGQRFEVFVDGNYAIVFTLTAAELSHLRAARDFPRR